MQRNTDRNQLYVLEQLQPRILLSADCLIDTVEPATPDNTPVLDAEAGTDDTSGEVKPDGIFYVRGMRPDIQEALVDDSGEVTADDAGEASPDDGIVYTLEMRERTLGDPAEEGAEVGTDDTGPNIFFPLNDNVDLNGEETLMDPIICTMGPVEEGADPNLQDTPSDVLYMTGGPEGEVSGPNVFHPLNEGNIEEEVDPVIYETGILDGPNVFHALNDGVDLGEEVTPVILTAPDSAQTAQTDTPAAAPVTNQSTDQAAETNPLLSKKQELLTENSNLLA